MHKGRMEAFSDGVIAIIITIMILELKIPEEGDVAALIHLLPKFLSYIFSFIFIGIYWSNHHHILQASKHVSGGVLWANLNLLFWLSIVPFVTGWMGETNFATLPVAAYGVVLMLSGASFYILVRSLIAVHSADSVIVHVLNDDKKGLIALVVYAAGIVFSFISTWIALALYVFVSILYLVPDKRIEKKMIG